MNLVVSLLFVWVVLAVVAVAAYSLAKHWHKNHH